MKRPLIKYAIMLAIFFAGCATDQLSKNWAADNLRNRPGLTLVKNIIDLGYTENHGMVFGINNRQENHVGRNVLLAVRIAMSIGLTIFLVRFRTRPLWFHLPFLLILSGAVGNVIDSLMSGHVIDFIHLHAGSFLDWPFLFNLADAYVCIGMGILILQSFSNESVKKTDLPLQESSTGERTEST